MSSVVMQKVGPGQWHDIHSTAAWADTPEKRKFFSQWVRNLREYLKCGDCRGHMAKYLEAHPPEKAEDPFIWSWEFHNAVNKRLGKPEMEYTTAAKMYLQGEVRNCTEGCGEDPTEPKNSSLVQSYESDIELSSENMLPTTSQNRVDDTFTSS